MKKLLLIVGVMISTGWAADTLTIGLHKTECQTAQSCLTFDSLLSDSRCPTGSVCMWQGMAEVRLTLDNPLLMGPYPTGLTFDLNTENHTDTILRGLRITLLSVEPYPATNVRIDPSGYSVTLAVEDTGSGTGTGGDYVTVTPPKPTTRDSLLFTLHLAAHCCCSRFVDPSLSAQDTVIYLSYSVDDASCMACFCFAGGSSHQFQSGPLKAGTYGIYKVENYYCPVGPCPMGLIMPVRVGEVTVTTPLSAERRLPSRSAPIEVYPNPLTGGARIILGSEYRGASVIMKIYDLRGSVVADLSKSFAGRAGMEWDASDVPPGIYLLKAETAGRSWSRRILIQ